MTYLGALAVGLVVHRGMEPRAGRRTAGLLGAAAACAVAAPGLVLPIGLIGLALWARVRLRERRTPGGDGTGVFGRTLLIGLSAGLSLGAALELAGREADPVTAAEVDAVLRTASRVGLAAALAQSSGAGAGLFVRLARAQITGSSPYRTVAAFVDEDRRTRRAETLERIQRLPVKLTLPLALLILPGFVLLTIGPVVVSTLQRLLGPVLT